MDDVAQVLEPYDALDTLEGRHNAVGYALDRLMMRLREPRAGFVPRLNWQNVPAPAPQNPKPQPAQSVPAVSILSEPPRAQPPLRLRQTQNSLASVTRCAKSTRRWRRSWWKPLPAKQIQHALEKKHQQGTWFWT
ncbi:MAG UNVERIFIED_CONTAM: hypothetical protein LVT10_04170 [Anaerolineae bacterium]